MLNRWLKSPNAKSKSNSNFHFFFLELYDARCHSKFDSAYSDHHRRTIELDSVFEFQQPKVRHRRSGYTESKQRFAYLWLTFFPNDAVCHQTVIVFFYGFPMRVFHQKNSSNAKSYYEASDYYESGPENLRGQWIGRGAQKLGLTGDVDQDKFERLCDNQHPFEDQRLTQRNHAARRVLTDITFSAPKSVSVLFAATEDQDVLEAVQASANATFHKLERDAMTRVNHTRGELTTEFTGNLTAASWLHVTARPVDDPQFGPHPDPQLHVHFATINCTHVEDDRWTAVDLSKVVRDSKYYDAFFQSTLATKLQQLGYPVQQSEHNFEIAGVSRETIDRFSRRKDEVDQLVAKGVAEKLATKERISLAEAKGQLGARSRAAKSNLYTIDELPNVWRKRITPEEQQRFDKLKTDMVLPDQNRQVAAVDFAIKHSFQNESVIRERSLLSEAMLAGIGNVTTEEILTEFNRRDWIRQGEGADAVITTQEILAEEQALLTYARSGRGSVTPLAPQHRIEREWLSDEQKEAVLGLLNSHDRLQILRGVAGSGKTTLMKEAIGGIEKNGYAVTVLAPTAAATHEVLGDQEGFEAKTLASFIVDRTNQSQAAGGVIWVDEAGLIGTEDMAKLVQIADRLDARIILSGDKQQHKSVARGMPLRLLENEAGVVPQEVRKIRRQSGQYRESIQCLSRGDVTKGFQMLDDLGYVHQIPDGDRYQRMATDYADSVDSGIETLVIAPTHAERALVTNAIRTEMKHRGHIQADDHTISILKSKRLGEARKENSVHYSKDDVIEFVTRGKGGFKAGDRLRVTSIQDGKVIADSRKGRVEVPLDSPKSFEVYRWQEAKFAVGDKIRITKNDTKNKIYNGSMATLKNIGDDGVLHLSNGKTVDSNWGFFENGLTVTSHSSQGKSYKRVLVSQSSISFPASSPEQIYVSASRGTERLDIYTDDKVGLREAVQGSRPSLMASELNPQRKNESAQDRVKKRVTEYRNLIPQLIRNQLHRFQEWLQDNRQFAR